MTCLLFQHFSLLTSCLSVFFTLSSRIYISIVPLLPCCIFSLHSPPACILALFPFFLAVSLLFTLSRLCFNIIPLLLCCLSSLHSPPVYFSIVLFLFCCSSSLHSSLFSSLALFFFSLAVCFLYTLLPVTLNLNRLQYFPRPGQSFSPLHSPPTSPCAYRNREQGRGYRIGEGELVCRKRVVSGIRRGEKEEKRRRTIRAGR